MTDEKKVGMNGEPQIKRFLGELEFVTGRIEAAKFVALFGVNCSDRSVMNVGKVRPGCVSKIKWSRSEIKQVGACLGRQLKFIGVVSFWVA